ncbi:MAG TPA: aminotransferase class I/II-fold pyridoxal phosphate-dependent enzyme [Blastocatellia bacterium]|jgi:aspartate/methionine/tyrosine aminotransferase
MQFEPFLLEHWLNRYHFADPPIEFDIASSTGPRWTLGEMMNLMDEDERQRLFGTDLVYTDGPGIRPLREAIAEMQGVSTDDVLALTGASEALLLLFFRAAREGANVVLPFPSFPPFAEMPRSFGTETRYYHLRPENQFRIDTDEIKNLVDENTQLILVNSPHNPTGATVSDDELTSLHEFASERGVQLVVDEVYHPIYHGRETSSASRLPSATVLGDFSKSFCLSGLRVGWMVERDPARREEYINARGYVTISNAVINETLATHAVQKRETIFARVREAASKNLALLEKFFDEHRDALDWARPQGGMTIFPWLRSGADARSFCEGAAAAGVLLAPGDCFRMPAHFRLGFAAIGDRFPAALERLSDFVRKYSTRASAV